MIDFKALWEKQWVKMTAMLLLGVTIGALFYPTKTIEEKVSQKYEEKIQSLKEQHESQFSKMELDYLEMIKTVVQKKEEVEKKVTKLQEEVKTLQSKQKTAYYKLIKPDGTIEIKKFTESEVNESTKVVTQIQEEFKTKIEQIETKWSQIHQTRVEELKKDFDSKESLYKQTIASLEKSKKVTINEKRFGLEAGFLSNNRYYGHATMDLWGPFFFGLHGELSRQYNDGNLGAGLGIRF